VKADTITILVGGVVLIGVIQAIGWLLDRYGVVLCVLGFLLVASRVVWARSGGHW
jgi:hypothetical protein